MNEASHFRKQRDTLPNPPIVVDFVSFMKTNQQEGSRGLRQKVEMILSLYHFINGVV
jgi:hypothetical protein